MLVMKSYILETVINKSSFQLALEKALAAHELQGFLTFEDVDQIATGEGVPIEKYEAFVGKLALYNCLIINQSPLSSEKKQSHYKGRKPTSKNEEYLNEIYRKYPELRSLIDKVRTYSEKKAGEYLDLIAATRNGNLVATHRLFYLYSRVAFTQAWIKTKTRSEEFKDALSAAFVALMENAVFFNAKNPFHFQATATQRIHREIISTVFGGCPTLKSAFYYPAFDDEVLDYYRNLLDNPEKNRIQIIQEISEKFSCPFNEAEKFLNCDGKNLSLESCPSETFEESVDYLSVTGSTSLQDFEYKLIFNELIKPILEDWKRAQPKYVAVIQMRYGLDPFLVPFTCQEIAERLNLTRARVQQIEKLVMNRLISEVLTKKENCELLRNKVNRRSQNGSYRSCYTASSKLDM